MIRPLHRDIHWSIVLFMCFLAQAVIISLNNIRRSLFVMEILSAFYNVELNFLMRFR
jgi:hypothetical protein